eukprot:Rmarinus@m.22021
MCAQSSGFPSPQAVQHLQLDEGRAQVLKQLGVRRGPVLKRVSNVRYGKYFVIQVYLEGNRKIAKHFRCRPELQFEDTDAHRQALTFGTGDELIAWVTEKVTSIATKERLPPPVGVSVNGHIPVGPQDAENSVSIIAGPTVKTMHGPNGVNGYDVTCSLSDGRTLSKAFPCDSNADSIAQARLNSQHFVQTGIYDWIRGIAMGDKRMREGLGILRGPVIEHTTGTRSDGKSYFVVQCVLSNNQTISRGILCDTRGKDDTDALRRAHEFINSTEFPQWVEDHSPRRRKRARGDTGRPPYHNTGRVPTALFDPREFSEALRRVRRRNSGSGMSLGTTLRAPVVSTGSRGSLNHSDLVRNMERDAAGSSRGFEVGAGTIGIGMGDHSSFGGQGVGEIDVPRETRSSIGITESGSVGGRAMLSPAEQGGYLVDVVRLPQAVGPEHVQEFDLTQMIREFPDEAVQSMEVNMDALPIVHPLEAECGSYDHLHIHNEQEKIQSYGGTSKGIVDLGFEGENSFNDPDSVLFFVEPFEHEVQQSPPPSCLIGMPNSPNGPTSIRIEDFLLAQNILLPPSTPPMQHHSDVDNSESPLTSP